MRVSNSGATVLRLAIELADGHSVDLVLKVLSPDSVNIFKIDRRFDARSWETALMRWWGEQSIPQLPVVYDTRADHLTREYWILHEYFPCVGWTRSGQTVDRASQERLMGHVAVLHAHSRSRLEELRALQTGDALAHGSSCPPSMLVHEMNEVLADTGFIANTVALSSDELSILSDCMTLIDDRPSWVDEWDYVCINRDFSLSNTAVRGTGQDSQLVSFDWCAAHIGPIEQDFEVLLGRDLKGGKSEQDRLIRRYLAVYAELTGHRMDSDVFRARIPWEPVA